MRSLRRILLTWRSTKSSTRRGNRLKPWTSELAPPSLKRLPRASPHPLPGATHITTSLPRPRRWVQEDLCRGEASETPCKTRERVCVVCGKNKNCHWIYNQYNTFFLIEQRRSLSRFSPRLRARTGSLQAFLLGEPDLAGLPGSDNHRVVVWLWDRAVVGEQLEVELPQQDAHEDLDLHVGKSLSHAAVPSAPKADEGEGPLLVLLPPGSEPVWIILQAVAVDRLESVRKSWGSADDVPLWNVNLLALGRLRVKALMNVPHQHNQRRVQSQSLLHGSVEVVHLGKDVVIQLLPVLLNDVPLLLQELGQELVPVLF
mmetsp:Transcript_14184/g.40206  ORF Transcript_14184/g.40206 Transcript_14184/m.40206 type:complete len:315 (-) Transcript_14184:1047-1991(-)